MFLAAAGELPDRERRRCWIAAINSLGNLSRVRRPFSMG